jgi:hypothetical protein
MRKLMPKLLLAARHTLHLNSANPKPKGYVCLILPHDAFG